ncbi:MULTISPECIES: hypothetical protein [Streptomyces]|uniref:hypothetical protein n=1 Tax=Streptomyces TaxID=1883 RepID=UPI00186AF1CA|nr:MULTISPECIES: hypothetical protein [Streptomyces]
MSGPSSAPRPEHTPRPGAAWETALAGTGEVYIPDGQPEPRPNRATRRAAARNRRRRTR